MDGAWVDRLERRIGFLAAPGLASFVTGMTAVIGVLQLFKPEFALRLVLIPSLVLRGQLWRVLTFAVVPPPIGPLFLMLWLMVVYMCLRPLEHAWGDFKFTIYLLIGLSATVAGSLAVGIGLDNTYLILACFLALARLMPEQEWLIMFVLPVKLRWLAALAALWIALEFATSWLPGRVEIAAGMAPYLLFFGPGHWQDLRFAWRRWRRGL